MNIKTVASLFSAQAVNTKISELLHIALVPNTIKCDAVHSTSGVFYDWCNSTEQFANEFSDVSFNNIGADPTCTSKEKLVLLLLDISQFDKDLKAFDWYYEMSDDHRAWVNGNTAFSNLKSKRTISRFHSALFDMHVSNHNAKELKK